MAPSHVVRGLPGVLATVLAVIATTVVAFTGTASLFYEGWGQPIARMAGYLAPALALLALFLVALRWPRAGGALLLGAGFVAWALWLTVQVQRGMAPLGQLLFSAAMLLGPVVLAALLFLLEGRHRRLLREEGVAASPRWIVRSYRYVLLVGVPLLGVSILAVQQLPGLLARHDDGLRGARVIEGNGVTLEWAPRGAGWNSDEPGTGPLSWESLTRHGGSSNDRCAFLSEDGASLLSAPAASWRLPTADEIVLSLTRGGTNAGCAWDRRSPHAACRTPPDKETPLWAPDEAPIYYWSSEEADRTTAFAVNYTGGISVLPKSMRGIGFRCVRDVAAAGSPSEAS